jgi:hypothetical protein
LEDLERDPTSFYTLDKDPEIIRAYERKRREVLKKERSKQREQNGGMVKKSASTSRKEYQSSFTVRVQPQRETEKSGDRQESARAKVSMNSA